MKNLSTSIVSSNNENFEHFSICYVDKLIFPHPGASILVHANLIQQHIQSIIETYGPYAVKSRHYASYYQFSNDDSIKFSSPHLLHRMRKFNSSEIMGKLSDVDSINKICLVAESLIEPQSKSEDYMVKVNLHDVYFFAESIPEELKSIYFSEKEVTVVEAWLGSVDGEIVTSENADILSYQINLNLDDKIGFKLLHKMEDLVDQNLVVTANKTGFFNLDVIAIEKAIFINAPSDEQPKEDDMLEMDEIFNGLKAFTEILKSNEEPEKPSILMSMSEYQAESFIHPMLEMFDDAYKKVDKIIVDEYGVNSTAHIRKQVAEAMLSTMCSFDIFVQRNNTQH